MTTLPMERRVMPDVPLASLRAFRALLDTKEVRIMPHKGKSRDYPSKPGHPNPKKRGKG